MSEAEPSDLDLLSRGEFLSWELTPHGSNYTFLAELELDGRNGHAIYKPRKGEIPLWDFPSGTLFKRECAAYLLSRILGWDFIPLTVIRDGPHGIGSAQLFVDHDPKENYYTISRDSLDESDADQLRMMCCFDLVANNTDRKANHVLRGYDGKLWGIDQGLTFHADTKIRTVIWDFGEEPIPDRLLEPLRRLCGQLLAPTGDVAELLTLLDAEEGRALMQRLQWVLQEGVFPGIPGLRRRRRG
ncbi:MAG: SCO1664 family protein [Chloroflexota bacterium]|nr:SCO1664 family protein [Chloroflexota bacterium]MDE2684199.1 SCO1664 family protein [Chloroflexota bacterium]